MSYPKALANIQMSAPTTDASAECSMCGDWAHMEVDLDLTKIRAYRVACKAGWTYDSAGDWACPECSAKSDCLGCKHETVKSCGNACCGIDHDMWEGLDIEAFETAHPLGPKERPMGTGCPGHSPRRTTADR